MSRRLFEQPDNNDPSLSKKIAFGGTSVITENISLTNFLTWLLTKLGFLKVTSNLSDVAKASAARTNLGVYSTSQVTSLLANKANTTAVLTKTNTVTYVPTTAYHPATKDYVDDYSMKVLWAGHITKAEVVTKYRGSLTVTAARISTGFFEVHHNIGDVNYIAVFSAIFINVSERSISFTSYEKYPSFFNVSFGNDASLDDIDFDCIIYEI